MSRHDEQRLADILAAAAAIADHMGRGGLDDGLVFDAVRVGLIEIGESVKAIDPDLLAREPDIPWVDVAGMRDHLAHRYYGWRAELVRDQRGRIDVIVAVRVGATWTDAVAIGGEDRVVAMRHRTDEDRWSSRPSRQRSGRRCGGVTGALRTSSPSCSTYPPVDAPAGCRLRGARPPHAPALAPGGWPVPTTRPARGSMPSYGGGCVRPGRRRCRSARRAVEAPKRPRAGP